MPFVPPWLEPPNFLGAMEAGSRIGLSEQEMQRQSDQHAAELSLQRDELSARMAQAAAERGQQQQQEAAANALRAMALKQQGLLGEGRLQNESDRNDIVSGNDSARVALEQQRLEKPQFFNTGGGLAEIDPVTGQPKIIPNTSKASQEPKVKISVGQDKSGKDILQEVPASQALNALQKSGYVGWSNNPINKASLAYASSIQPSTATAPAADALRPQPSPLLNVPMGAKPQGTSGYVTPPVGGTTPQGTSGYVQPAGAALTQTGNGGAKSPSNAPYNDIQFLLENPNQTRIATFEKKYGAGTAQQILAGNSGANLASDTGQ